MRFSKALLIASILSIATLSPTNASAAGEMLGKWHLQTASSRLHFQFELFEDHAFMGPWERMTGTVDQMTGEVHLTGPGSSWGGCDWRSGFDGRIAPDGRSLEGVVHWADGPDYGAFCYPVSYPVEGTRCGNGIIDSWEECDHLPGWPDCCSTECTLEGQGVACRIDDNPCTDDICDGAGTCEAFENSAACTPDGNCGTGLCAGGACEVEQPFDAGTPCDLDESVCTPDACDGVGQCAAASPIDCSPCTEECDSSFGCYTYITSDLIEQCEWNLAASMDLQSGESSERSLKMSMRGQVATEEIGDPTTTTSYTLCLFRDLYGSEIEVGRIEIPAGERCGDADCWKPRPQGFSYRKSDESGDGRLTARVSSRGPIGVKASGAQAISFPESLPGPFPESCSFPYLAMLVATDGESRSCWAQLLEPSIDTTSRFKGRGTPSVPGALQSKAAELPVCGF
jgi:hypothetical protein